MTILKKSLVAAVVGIGAAAFNFLYNSIPEDHRGLLIFFSLLLVLVVALNRRGGR